ncbi:TVP38/TMEM64 family protein [Rheinheimera marina]|uniref:TVP38/TMEM64 family membrane protein n=1 Tax=Rheinheimera marina TaxID=1774958 RepID=A0ABV9JQD8_9GAMM
MLNPSHKDYLLRLGGRVCLLALLCVLGSVVAEQLPSISAFDQSWMDSHTRDNGLWGMLNYLWVATLFISVGLPRQLAAFLGGYAFGFVEGVLLSTLAASLSCLLVLLLSRAFARPLLNYFFLRRVQQIAPFLQQQPFSKALVLRLLPVGNNLLTNLAAGVCSVAVLPFLLGSTLGYLPQMLVFALMGKGVLLQSGWKIALSLMLFVLSSVLSWRLYQRQRQSASTMPEAAIKTNGDLL